jgi:hypothetical protein
MLERYLSDPSDDESADINHIKAAATKTTELCFTALVSPQTFSLFSPPFYCSSESTSIDQGLINLEYPAYRSVSGPRSLGGKSGESNISAASAGSIGSYISLSGRRKSALRIRCRSPGRKAKKHNPEQHIPKTQFMYECTFCMATFKTQGNWVRHEESIHLVLDKWICAPKGPTDLQTGLCVYCRCKHLPDDTSQYCRSVCAAKDIKTRTFCRKGHLKQHLKRIHGTEWRGAFDSWLQRSSPPDISRCGFCGSNFNSWARRKIHVGAHFYAGKKMEEWDGDWGFSTDWMKRLDGAILPSERLRYRLTDNCENFSKLMDKYDEPCKPQDDRELNFWNFDARLFSTSRCDLENTISLRCKSPEKWLVCDVLDDHEPGSPNSQVPESQLVTSYYDNKEDTLRNTRKRKRDEVCTKPIDTPQYPQYPAKLISQHTSNSSDEGATPANPSKKKQRLTRQLPVI